MLLDVLRVAVERKHPLGELYPNGAGLRKALRSGAGEIDFPAGPLNIGDVRVKLYFGAGWAPKVFDTCACSRDLVNWTKWAGPHLVEPTEPWDKTYAHKPWVLKHEGVVYHFYCAVGDEGRVIALATSSDLRAARKP